MKHKFKNGVTVEGTLAQIQEMAEKLGEPLEREPGTYLSDSLGKVVKISDMSYMHLRNAILKRFRYRLQRAEDAKNMVDFAKEMGTYDNLIHELVEESVKRAEKGQNGKILSPEAEAILRPALGYSYQEVSLEEENDDDDDHDPKEGLTDEQIAALVAAMNSVRKAANQLGIPRSTLYDRITKRKDLLKRIGSAWKLLTN